MKRIFLFILMLFVSVVTFSQAAGNFYDNQKAQRTSYESYDQGLYQGFTNNNAYYGQTYTTSSADSVMSISATVMMNQAPDAWVMILGLSQVGEDLEETHLKINQRIDALKNSLGDGFEDDDFYIDFISQSPIFGMEVEKKLFSTNYVEVPAGFEVKKNLHIRFSKLELAETIIMQAAQNEIYDIIKVDPVVSDKQVVYEAMRAECIKIIQSKKESYAALGMEVVPMFNTLNETVNCIYPINQYRKYLSFLDHTRQRLRGNERLVTATGSTNLFYQKASDAAFDKVLNAEVHGPVLQFTMSMQLVYTIERSSN